MLRKTELTPPPRSNNPNKTTPQLKTNEKTAENCYLERYIEKILGMAMGSPTLELDPGKCHTHFAGYALKLVGFVCLSDTVGQISARFD